MSGTSLASRVGLTAGATQATVAGPGTAIAEVRHRPQTAHQADSPVAKMRSEIEADFGQSISGSGQEYPISGHGEIYLLACNRETMVISLFFATEKSAAVLVAREVRSRYEPNFVVKLREVQKSLLTMLAKETAQQKTAEQRKLGNTEEEFKKIIAECNLIPGRSDVHFEIKRPPARSKIRLRVDGDLGDYMDLDYESAETMVRVAYGIIGSEGGSTIDGANIDKQISQDGNLSFEYGDVKYALRLVTIPVTIHGGQDFVLRFLNEEPGKFGAGHGSIELASLGYSPKQLKSLYAASTTAAGLLLFVGVTGSGKSVSMGGLLNRMVQLSNGSRKFYSVENPVERILAGVTQINISSKAGTDKGEIGDSIIKTLRALMRGDPDVVAMGELRDKETAEFAIDATTTGHPCLGTLHCSDASEVPSRFDLLRVERAKITGENTIAIIVAQTLLPTVCKACSTPILDADPLDPVVIRSVSAMHALGLGHRIGGIRIANVNRNGSHVCPVCNGAGYKGRTLVAEVLAPNAQIRAAWQAGEDRKAKAAWLASGGFTRLEHAIAKMLDGELDPPTAERVITGIGDLSQSRQIREELGIRLFDGEV